jgi:hypothetical protein
MGIEEELEQVVKAQDFRHFCLIINTVRLHYEDLGLYDWTRILCSKVIGNDSEKSIREQRKKATDQWGQ